jgi:membrane-associated protease RseP (regulator of RpoE activity)
MMSVLLLVAAFTLLTWGFLRAKPYGQLGLLVWMQAVVLIIPWLVVFSSLATGTVLNLVWVLFLLVLSIGIYIVLGNRLRAMGDPDALKKSSHPAIAPPEGSIQPTVDAKLSSNQPPKPTAKVATDNPMPAEDLSRIQTIFGVDSFFATETIPYQSGAIFRGNLRGEVKTTFAQLTANLAKQVGDRYHLFLMAGLDDKPVVVVLPSATAPKPAQAIQWVLVFILALATVATVMAATGLLLGFDLSTNLERYQETLPISLGIFAILATHEVGHWSLAIRHQVRLSPPFLLPTWQIGSFGAITRFESLLPHRTALFDIAFAGPALGGLLSLILLISGLLLSHPGSSFQVPSQVFQGSLLIGTLARLALGHELQQSIVDIHPLVLVGWLGLILTAINLMPAGQLDGGRIALAIFGRKVAGRTTIATLLLLGLATLVNPLALYWATLILFLQRDLDRPALNELSETSDIRATLGLLALFFMVITLLPFSPGLAGRLGIGG